jgi:hypothetical protein
MPVYVTFREGPNPARSVPLFVVSDDRLVDALIHELRFITHSGSDETPARRHPSAARREPRVLEIVTQQDDVTDVADHQARRTVDPEEVNE